MRLVVFIILVMCGLAVRAADITGVIYTKGTLTQSVEVGYVGMTADDLSITCMAGITPHANGGECTCTTYKPRTSTVKFSKDSGWTFQHTHLPVGRYLVYAKYGDNYLDWQLVAVTNKNARMKVSLGINPGKTGAINLKVEQGAGDYNVTLTPLDAKGKIAVEKLEDDFNANIKVDFTGKSATVQGVKPGKYRLALRAAHKHGSKETGMFTTYDDIGSWNITVTTGTVFWRAPSTK